MAVFRADPCGIVCLVMTYCAVFYADYVVVRWLVLSTPALAHSLWGAFNVLAFNVVVFLLLMAHARAAFSDPGIVPLLKHRIDFSDALNRTDAEDEDIAEDEDTDVAPLTKNRSSGSAAGALSPPQRDWTICTRCEMYRPPRAHHCRICQRCIRKMDHHCPWINNCVGEWNQKYFIQFLFYVSVLAVYAVLLVAIAWYSPCHGAECPNSRKMDIRVKQARILHSVILVLESVLFGMFVVAIGCDQFEAIFTDETLVEQAASRARPQQRAATRRSKKALLAEVCGHGHPVTWLLPCHTSSKSSSSKTPAVNAAAAFYNV